MDYEKFDGAVASAGGAGISYLIVLVICVFAIVCIWKCYKKMGEPGWKSLIPFYCNYVLCKHTWDSGWIMLTWFIPVFGSFVMLATYWRWFKGFGKSVLFRIFGLIFTPIALAICAFDSSSYAHPNTL